MLSPRCCRFLIAVACAGLFSLSIPIPNASLTAVVTAQAPTCSSGARTLAQPGSVLYPDQGNGGYKSLSTTLLLNYDSATNLFLPGTQAQLTIQATKCLSDFSFDFERTNGVTSTTTPGPNLSVGSVTVNGQPATFSFVQPTYPGDPNGQDDPDPAAHAASSTNPVSATNPNPPACSPQGNSAALNGTPCPANKLLITPTAPIPNGSLVTVTISYTGRPGVHIDGDGTSEGWFRVNLAADQGGVVTSEPAGHQAWMPLNNHPTAAPTYDVRATVPTGKIAVSSGVMSGVTDNPPDANFPGGSQTYRWVATFPVPSYRLAFAVGNFGSDTSVTPVGGTNITLYRFQSLALTAQRTGTNDAVLDQQGDTLRWLSEFVGPFPFPALGNLATAAATPFQQASSSSDFFTGGTVSLSTLTGLTSQQWFGSNVIGSDFNLTFIHTGFGLAAQYLLTAGNVADTNGGLLTPTGQAAFDASLVSRFNTTYNSSANFWTVAPSKPTVGNLFSNNNQYVRPAATFLALRQILGGTATQFGLDRWIMALKKIQSDFGGQAITKTQFEDVFHQFLPNQSAGCYARLDAFFTEWLDTPYAAGGGANKPQITGPGLAGGGFYDDASACTRADQTIPFGPLSNRLLGDPDFALPVGTSVSSAGLPATFGASGVCTLTATNSVHLTGSIGTCTITASQAGNSIYKPVEVPQSFQVTAAAGTVTVVGGGFTFSPVTRRYVQTVTLTNIGPAPISGPISLVLDALRPGVTLFNASGVTTVPAPGATSGSPYVNMPSGLLPGSPATVTLQFTNPTNVPITYAARVVSGPGTR